MKTTTQGTPHFLTYRVALEAVAAVAPLIDRTGRRDSDLAKQLRRAAASMPLNIAEGNLRKGADRLHLFRVAAGSAAEVTAALDVAVAFGYVEHAATDNAQSLLDRVRALLYRQR